MPLEILNGFPAKMLPRMNSARNRKYAHKYKNNFFSVLNVFKEYLLEAKIIAMYCGI